MSWALRDCKKGSMEGGGQRCTINSTSTQGRKSGREKAWLLPSALSSICYCLPLSDPHRNQCAKGPGEGICRVSHLQYSLLQGEGREWTLQQAEWQAHGPAESTMSCTWAKATQNLWNNCSGSICSLFPTSPFLSYWDLNLLGRYCTSWAPKLPPVFALFFR
jgi:hypothetical protein